jgi:hypothetical protein
VEVKVKKYRNTAAANRDSLRMAAEGWAPQGMAGGGTRFSLGKGIVNKGAASAVLGPLGLFASSRTEQPVTITWTRTPEAAEAVTRQKQATAAAVAQRRADAAQRRTEADAARRKAKDDRKVAKQEGHAAKAAQQHGLAHERDLAEEEHPSRTPDGAPNPQLGRVPGQPATPPSQQLQASPARGWYADPSGQARSRWWNGKEWTKYTQ